MESYSVGIESSFILSADPCLVHNLQANVILICLISLFGLLWGESMKQCQTVTLVLEGEVLFNPSYILVLFFLLVLLFAFSGFFFISLVLKHIYNLGTKI